MTLVRAILASIWNLLTAPWRAFVAMLTVLVNLSARQMRSIFSLAMLGGIIALCGLIVGYTYEVQRAIGLGNQYNEYVGILFWVIRFFCFLTAWFSGIMGLIVFGADWLRARYGTTEFGFGKGDAPAEPDQRALAPDVTEPPEDPVYQEFKE